MTGPGNRETPPSRRRHWYFVSTWYCPVCARTETIRERRYSPKPRDRANRGEFVEAYDYCNAL